MIKVLFVCLGNICRSPMAEAILRYKINEANLNEQIDVDSAGTGDWHVGKIPHRGTRNILNQAGISYDNIRARQVINEDLQKFDYIVAMDANNLDELHRIAGHKETGVISRLLDFVPKKEIEDVPDPYFTGNFDLVYNLIDEACDHLLSYIREKENI